MKKISLFTVLLALLGGFSLPLYAQGADNDQFLSDSTRNIDQFANTPSGRDEIISRLKSQYNVSDDQISQLRNQNLGYGDIQMVLILSQKMPGGTSKENINRIATMRQANPNGTWAPISQELGVDMNDVRGRLTQVGLQNSNTQAGNGAVNNPPQAGTVSNSSNPNLVTGQPVGSNGLITGQNQRYNPDGTPAQSSSGTSAGGTTTGGQITGSSNPSIITGQGQTQQNQGSSTNTRQTPPAGQTGGQTSGSQNSSSGSMGR